MEGLGVSYKSIMKIAFPIMLGSAGQNVVTLSDSIFLFHYNQISFAAVGVVGVFYLMLNAIGYSVSKGGQIIIARRTGEANDGAVKKSTQTLIFFQALMALGIFILLYFSADFIFKVFISDHLIRELSSDYLIYRLPGIFFSYLGFSFIALYSALGRTKFILIDTFILLVINLVLNYSLIFGKFGLPEMGIGGAALASTIAEGVAFICFVIYVYTDKKIRKYNLWRHWQFDKTIASAMVRLSSPITAQSALSIGSWFLFFALIEKMGPDALAISNLVRVVYLTLSVPYWGFASSVNTYVSTYIGIGKFAKVIESIQKTSVLCLVFTIAISLPVMLYPVEVLYPLLGKEDNQLIIDSGPVLWVLFIILCFMSVAGIIYNALVGTGGTFYGLKIQAIGLLFYIGLVALAVFFFNGSLELVWGIEILYWFILGGLSLYYFKSYDWKSVTV